MRDLSKSGKKNVGVEANSAPVEKPAEEFVMMIFPEDKTVDGKEFATAGVPVKVAKASVERGQKRGGKIVGDKQETAEPTQEAAPATGDSSEL